METKTILHILRNPSGFSYDQIMDARLAACDLIEKYEKEATNKPKKYLLFLMNFYEANGGMLDFIDVFNSIEECKNHAKATTFEWFQIVDRDTLLIVAENYCDSLV